MEFGFFVGRQNDKQVGIGLVQIPCIVAMLDKCIFATTSLDRVEATPFFGLGSILQTVDHPLRWNIRDFKSCNDDYKLLITDLITFILVRNIRAYRKVAKMT